MWVPRRGRLSRAIGLCFVEENAVESRAELPVNHEPENRYHDTRHNPARIHQRMEKQNVDNYWPSDCQCQWSGSSKEKQHSRDQLQSKNKHQVVRRRHDREVLAGHLGWRRRLGDEVQKTVQTEDDEDQREQISRDGGSDLHEALLLGLRSLCNDTGAPADVSCLYREIHSGPRREPGRAPAGYVGREPDWAGPIRAQLRMR